MNSQLQARMLKHGIEIRCHVSEPELKWWMGRFGNSTALFPAGICKYLSADIDCDHLYALENIDIHSEEASVSLVGQFHSELVYQAARSIAFRSTQISMDYLKVEEAFRGKGISVRLVRNAYSLARELDLARLSVAAVDVGSYLWARMGFLATKESWTKFNCRGKITETIEAVSDLHWRIKDDLYKIVSSEDPIGLWDIADQQKLVNSTTVIGLRRPLGEVLLIESEASWRGTLEFFADGQNNKSPHLERLENYLGSRR